MRQLPSLSACDWITGGVLATDPPATVAHCIPPIFPAYAKLFHPVHLDLSVPDRESTWQERDEPDPGLDPDLAVVLRRSTLVYAGARPGSRLVPLRWAELAAQLGLPFAPTLSSWSFSRHFPGHSWPSCLIGPEEGNLPPAERDALAEVLGRHGSADRVLFHLWMMATTDWAGDRLFEGRLDEVKLFPGQVPGARCTPTHWFPPGRNWLVCTDYDLTFTLVGGPTGLIRTLLDHPVLECLPVQPGTRVDWQADDGEAPPPTPP